MYMKVLIAAFTISFTCVHSQPPVFLVDPVSVAAVNGTTVEFSCTASDATAIVYIVNRSSAGGQDVQDQGFVQLGAETLGGTVRRRNLTVTASSQYNNTEIFCQAVGSNPGNSETANLTIQGPLTSVGDFYSSFINSSTVHISWSPPYTLPGTAITGYNISVTSNGTTTNYFTSDSYYVLQLSDITDSPCNEINITVSGYNGLDGETDSISVPSSNPVVPLSVDISEDLQVTVRMNVTSICIGERPTTVDIAMSGDDKEVRSMDVMFSDNSTEIATAKTPYTIVEDMSYTVNVSFSIFDGDIDVSSRHVFDTFGVRSVNVTDTDMDSVFCICTFKPFSTDTGCTIKLVLSDIVQYEQNFTRSGSTATGSISGVATGLYLVNVFDQGNPTMVLTSKIMVIGEPATTTTTTSVTNSTATHTPTIPVYLKDPQTTLYTAVGVPTGVVIIILLAVVLTLVVCFVWQKNNSKGNRLELSKQPTTVEPEGHVYVDLTDIMKKHQSPSTKPATCIDYIYQEADSKGNKLELSDDFAHMDYYMYQEAGENRDSRGNKFEPSDCPANSESTGLVLNSSKPLGIEGQREGTNIQATTDKAELEMNSELVGDPRVRAPTSNSDLQQH